MADTMLRRGPLDGAAPLAKATRLKLAPTLPMARFIFRGSEAAAAIASVAFGPNLSKLPMRASDIAGRAALWLGPDEWLLMAPEADLATVARTVGLAVTEPHSLVDISHRNIGLTLQGARAADVINAGCPLDLDLDVFPVGMATRTMLAKAEIVLWRKATDLFHIECWRSFGPYVHGLLSEAAREYEAA